MFNLTVKLERLEASDERDIAHDKERLRGFKHNTASMSSSNYENKCMLM